MRADLTDITLVVDRSGSMSRIREDAEGGVNTFVSQQAREPGEALFTCLLYTSPSPRDQRGSRMPSSA